MSKLNFKKVKTNPKDDNMSLSKNGNPQYIKDSVYVLFETVVGSLYGNDSYYETSNDKVSRMRSALVTVIETHGIHGARYALNVARFAREEMFIRTMPIVMTVELSKILRDKNIQLDGFKDAVAYLIQRADQLTDMYSYALNVFESKTKVPLSIKKGVAGAFNKFNEYQFGKYNRKDGLTLKDLLRIVHPKPIDISHAEIFNKIMSKTLESPYTWEVELSKNGQLPPEEQKTKEQIWTELINHEGSGSIGYMALIRNLRNMNDAKISDETWYTVADKIKNPISVEKSKQLPFGFINAYEVAVSNNLPSIVLNALTEATELSIKNIPSIGKKIWIILYSSGSMNSRIGYQEFRGKNGNDVSPNTAIKIGAIFSSILVKSAVDAFDIKFTMFDNNAEMINLNQKDSVFSLYQNIIERNAGGGTNLQAALDLKSELGFEPDTVIILSDMEVNMLRCGDLYNMFSDDCVKIAINLVSGNTTPLSERNGWIQLSGWSERIFQFINFSRNEEGIVKRIFDASE